MKDRLKNLLLLVVAISVFLLAAESFLRAFLPAQLVSIGKRTSENARLYGWGFSPNEQITLSDPDTGRVFSDRVNNFGWRDKDREITRKPGTLRILVLGDSNTFAPLVSGEQTYTQLLEKRLEAEGTQAEVINISYGGWSIDQELEAFEHIGKSFKPDLVILQFCYNDLSEVAKAPEAPPHKPFFYALSQNGELVNGRNEAFFREARENAIRHHIKSFVTNSEILKRLYLIYRDTLLSKQVPLASGGYMASPAQILRFMSFSGLGNDNTFIKELKVGSGSSLDVAWLKSRLQALDLPLDASLRQFENRNFLKMYPDYQPRSPQVNEITWQLYFAVFERLRQSVQAAGADFAVISDAETGLYKWERYWNRIAPDETTRLNFLAPSQFFRDRAAKENFIFIESTVPHERARNDPHPNASGNMAIADNIYAALIARYGQHLERLRRNAS